MKNILILVCLSCATLSGYAQSIGIGTTTPSNEAILDIQSSSKGVLIPRMTRAQRDAIGTTGVSNGLLIYQNNESPGFYYNAGSTIGPVDWVRMSRKVDTVVIGPEAFLPILSSTSYSMNAYGARFVNTDGSVHHVKAPVSLPAGVKITKVNFSYYDNSSANNLRFELRSNSLVASISGLTPFETSTGGAVADTRVMSVTNTYQVQSHDESYYILVLPISGSSWLANGDVAIKGAMIIFER
ncbi:MAG: hypothetical protein ABIQ56_01545 [Chitinophagaceae bacterium]